MNVQPSNPNNPIVFFDVTIGGQIKEDIDKLEDKLEYANNTLKGDWSRWQKSMRSDLRAVFTQTAEKNVEYYEKCLAVWESFLLSQRPEAKEVGRDDS